MSHQRNETLSPEILSKLNPELQNSIKRIQKYCSYSNDEVVAALWRGSLLAERTEINYDYKLYKIDGLYVEAKIESDTGIYLEMNPYSDLKIALLSYSSEERTAIIPFCWISCNCSRDSASFSEGVAIIH